jgi:hypothetical protein
MGFFALGFLVLSWSPQSCEAQNSGSLADALTSGDGGVKFRLRFEFASVDETFTKDASALTLRTAIFYRTRAWNYLDLYLEAVDVSAADEVSYNNLGAGDLWNGVTDRPVIADPVLTQMNQVYLRFQGMQTTGVLGREEVNYDDQRFIGSVGWRQNHQTFEEIRFANNSIPNTTLNAAAFSRVHRVTGLNQPMTTFVFNGKYEFKNIGSLALFAYLLNFNNESAYGLSTNSFGGRLAGNIPAGAFKIPYELQGAQQSDAGKNPNSVSQQYAHVMAGLSRWGVSLKLGYEMLGGNGSDGRFTTTLATLHKFNGWADLFLVTPANGLQDLYAHLGGANGPVRWAVIYHEFRAESVGQRYGGEADLLLAYTTPFKMTIAAKGGLYNADTFRTDTQRAWTWISYEF